MRVDQDGGAEAVAPATGRVAAAGRVVTALSACQRQLWLVEVLRGAPTVLALRVLVRGDLDLRALQAAWCVLLDRHPLLRSRIELDPAAEPLLVVCAEADLPESAFEVVPVETLADPARRLDAASVPLGRLAATTTSGQEHEIRVELHHVIADADALEVLLRDLRTAYSGRSLGPGTTSAAADRVEATDRSMQHWREVLAAPPPPRVIGSADVPGSAGVVRARVPATTWSRLVRRCRAERVTTAAAVVHAVGRSLGDRPVLFTLAVSRRPATQRDELGMWVDLVPVHIDPGGVSFWPGAQATADVVLDALDASDVPYEQVLDLAPCGRESVTAAVSATVSLYEHDDADHAVAGSIWTSAPVDPDSVPHGLQIEVSIGAEVDVHVLFDGCSWSRPAAEQVLLAVCEQLDGAVDPAAPVPGAT